VQNVLPFHSLLQGAGLFTGISAWRLHHRFLAHSAASMGVYGLLLTALSAQTGYTVPQKYNIYHIRQRNNTATHLNSETIE